MEKVREIEEQLDKLEKTVKNATTGKQNVAQWKYSVMKKCIQPQFSNLLRTVPPENTIEAATELDRIINFKI